MISSLLFALIGTFAPLDRASAQFSVMQSPTALSGVQQNGVSYFTRLSLKNNGQAYAYWTIDTAGSVQDLYFMTGYLIPFSYQIELINLSTGQMDQALFLSEQSLTRGPDGSNMFPSGAEMVWDIRFTGAPDMFSCTQGWLPCTGFPGTTQYYAMYFRIYDANCSVNRTGYQVTHPDCIIASTQINTTSIDWFERNTTSFLVAIPPNEDVYRLERYQSPTPANEVPSPIAASCGGRLAKNFRQMLAAMSVTQFPPGYCF